MPYITEPTNVTSLIGWFQYVNTVTYGLFSYLIIFASFVIMFIGLKYFESEKAFATASFFTVIVAVLLNIMGLAHVDSVIYPFIALIVSIFVIKK